MTITDKNRALHWKEAVDRGLQQQQSLIKIWREERKIVDDLFHTSKLGAYLLHVELHVR